MVTNLAAQTPVPNLLSYIFLSIHVDTSHFSINTCKYIAFFFLWSLLDLHKYWFCSEEKRVTSAPAVGMTGSLAEICTHTLH